MTKKSQFENFLKFAQANLGKSSARKTVRKNGNVKIPLLETISTPPEPKIAESITVGKFRIFKDLAND